MIKVSVESPWSKATFHIDPYRDGRSIFAVMAAIFIAIYRLLRTFGQPVTAEWELSGTAGAGLSEMTRELRAASAAAPPHIHSHFKERADERIPGDVKRPTVTRSNVSAATTAGGSAAPHRQRF